MDPTLAAREAQTFTSAVSGKGGTTASVVKKAAKLAPAFFVLFGIGLAIILVFVLALPILIIGTIDYGLQESLGFDETVAILEEQGEYVFAESLAKGKVNDALAADFAEYGLAVGQVTASGDFVRTNIYIADLDSDNEIAANGEFRTAYGEGGELAVLFNDQVIKASDFVLAVESNPEMYAAYSNALNMRSRYYYSDEVDQVYRDMGLSRGNFNSWTETGDTKKDQESFNKILEKVLNSDEITETKGYELADSVTCTVTRTRADGSTYTVQVTENYTYDFVIRVQGEKVTEDKEDIKGLNECSVPTHFERTGASGVTSAMANEAKGGDSSQATKSAAVLLNTAASASEPYLAAKAFLALEEPLNRARIDGDGPLDQIMNVVSTPTEVTYTDMDSGTVIKTKRSILGTYNFSSAVSNTGYSAEEAASFSRDRFLTVAGAKDDTAMVKETTLQTIKTNDSDSLNKTMTGKSTEPSLGILSRADNNIDIALVKENSEVFQSIVGGNRIVEGGSFLSNTIDQRVIGALPSDEATVAEYHREVETVLARKADADRASLSPFDVSSPNTFLGSLVRKIGVSVVSSYGGGSSSILSAVNTVADLTNSSIASLTTGALADGNSGDFTETIGDCTTVKTADVSGNLYCSSHNTVSTKRIGWTRSQWEAELGGELDADGRPAEGSEFAEMVVLGMDRESTVGVQDAGVCEIYQENNMNILQKIFKGILSIAGLYDACSGVDEDVQTGAKYVLRGSSNENSEKMEKYSGYTLYSTVESLLDDMTSPVAKFKKEYYETHPRDNSTAGVIARRSGMTVAEAEAVLAYADYLTFIANYNTSGLYAFGQDLDFGLPKKWKFIVEKSETDEMLAVVNKFRDAREARRRYWTTA